MLLLLTTWTALVCWPNSVLINSQVGAPSGVVYVQLGTEQDKGIGEGILELFDNDQAWSNFFYGNINNFPKK